MADSARPGDAAQDAAALGELRSLLFGREKSDIVQIKERLENPQIRAQDLSRILPEAVTLRSTQDSRLGEALQPSVEAAIQVSVRKNPQPMVDALFPVIGPAIRKSIAETFAKLTQALNRTIENSLSPKSIKWRIEAWRTGRPFAEVALMRTLLFQVDQVLLIHRESGLLLQHVVAPSVVAPEADMVSAMMTAIQDFARDAFRASKEDALEAMQLGELTVWVVQGPLALLAAAIRGAPPLDLKVTLREALEKVHADARPLLQEFKGDSAPFESVRPVLESCLQSRKATDAAEAGKAKEKKKTPLLRYAVVAVLAILIGAWIFTSVRHSSRCSEFLARLQAEPGITVVSAESRGGKFRVYGLRDPLAADPLSLLEGTGLVPAHVDVRLDLHHSMHARFLSAREERPLTTAEAAYIARLKGQPGVAVVHVEARGDKLRVSGVRDPRAADPLKLLEGTELRAADIVLDLQPFQPLPADRPLRSAETAYLERLQAEPGIAMIRFHTRDGKLRVWVLRDPLSADPVRLADGTGLSAGDVDLRAEEYCSLHSKFVLERARRLLSPPDSLDLTLENGVLKAAGWASVDWIVEARARILGLPGVSAYDDGAVRVRR